MSEYSEAEQMERAKGWLKTNGIWIIAGIAILAASFAWFGMFFLIFIRLLPAFSVAEIKETLVAPMRGRKAS